ncbi:MAG: hypothetical protein HYY81_12755 [Deltaproteobacteria bacterium]|nr:hypothetical protein [Deltaproteobacteria bacterium]
MPEEENKINRGEIRDALLRSGYLLESRVESCLREHWGFVETNASYEDPETGKSRELDVYSMTAVKAGPEPEGSPEGSGLASKHQNASRGRYHNNMLYS